MLLDRKIFLVKERVAMLKLTDAYDIVDPETEQPVGIAREVPEAWIRYLRLVVSKQLLPTRIDVFESEEHPPLFSIHKPLNILRPTISITDQTGMCLGFLKSKVLTVGGGFVVLDAQQQPLAEINGDWRGWDFQILGNNGEELGRVTKKWAGLGKELLTSADNYIISINESAGTYHNTTILLLAAGLAIDMVFKERK